jgi:heat shock protein HslJ
MRRLALAILAGTVLLTSTACSLLQGDSDCGALPIAACSPMPPTESAVEWPAGRVFHATAITENGAPKQLVPGTELTVRFRAPYELEVYAGCNTLGITAHIEDENRIVPDEFMATNLACLDDRAAQDAWIADFFEEGPQWSSDSGDLILLTDTMEIRLTRQE